MSENQDDNKFEFIKEQIIEKKHKKLKKTFKNYFKTSSMAIVFGVIAALTFCLVEPVLYNLMNKEKNTNTPITFPTKYPEANEGQNSKDGTSKEDGTTSGNNQDTKPVVVEKTIEADVEDFTKMYEEIRGIAYKAYQSLVKVSGMIDGKDWFGNPVDQKMYTTGIVIADNREEYLIMVSWDRIKDASSIKIEFAEGVEIDAELHDYENDLNIALLSVNIEDIPENYKKKIELATLGESFSITVGNPIIAIGSPNGNPFSMEVGMITSKGNTFSITDNKLELFHTDIHDNNNGDGVILDMDGEVVGIITRTIKDELSKGLNTSISISGLKDMIEKMANKTPRRYFGIKSEDMTESAKKEHGVTSGIYVYEVEANSPAFLAEIKSGDIILEVAGQKVLSTSNFYKIISGLTLEQEVPVKIKRTSATTVKEMDLKVTIAEKAKK